MSEYSVEFKTFLGIDRVQDPVRLRPSYAADNTPIHSLQEAINVDIDNTGAISRRKAPVKIVSGTFHSLKAWPDICLVVSGTTLSRLNADNTVSALKTGVNGGKVSYCRIQGGDIYFTDGLIIGKITNGAYAALPAITTGITKDVVLNLMNTTRMQTPPGQLIEFHDNRIYVARDATIWYTDIMAYHRTMKTARIPLNGYITMMKAVNDGIWVSDGNLKFMNFSQPSDIKAINKADYNAIFGGIYEVPDNVLGGDMQNGKYFMTLTERGVCLLGDGGFFRNLTESKYPDITGITGAALFRKMKTTICGQTKTINQFIVSATN